MDEGKPSDIDILSKLQNLFLSSLLNVQKSSVFHLHWELGILLMPLRILKEKLMLYFHISSLHHSSLAHIILKTQERLCWPSLRDEVQDFFYEHEIYDVTKFSKASWKKFVAENLQQQNRLLLLGMAKKLKKVDYFTISCEDFKLKDYFNELNLEDSRIKYREVSSTMYTCRSHASSDTNNMRAQLRCWDCPSQDVINHWWDCISYKPYTFNRTKDSDQDLCDFYKSVIQHRQQQVK